MKRKNRVRAHRRRTKYGKTVLVRKHVRRRFKIGLEAGRPTAFYDQGDSTTKTIVI